MVQEVNLALTKEDKAAIHHLRLTSPDSFPNLFGLMLV